MRSLFRHRRRVLLVVSAALGLAACGGRDPLPPLSAIADAPFLRSGSSWTYRIEDTSFAEPQMVTLVFQKEDNYKEQRVLVFQAGKETLVYDRDLNFVAVLANGRVLREANPSYRGFDFPFYVDKEWHAIFSWEDHERRLSWVPVEVYWKVKDYRRIRVPAGEFRAFRLVSEPITNWGLEEEVWYAPDVKLPVKWQRVRTSAHYLGKGKENAELVEFSLK